MSQMIQLNDRIILIDKPCGETSFDTISRFKRMAKIKKLGHSGTLDKLASGLLVVATGRATRLTQFFLESDKGYVAEIKLGMETDTHDLDGEVVSTTELKGDEFSRLNDVLGELKGCLHQMPPVYSALKINGKRASDRVRKGEHVELKPRPVTIHSIEIVETDECAHKLVIAVECSKGTYIRSLVRDLGENLGCGAVMTGLRRVRSGAFSVDRALPVEAFFSDNGHSCNDALVSMEEAVSGMNRLVVSNEGAEKVRNGARFRADLIVEQVDLGSEKTALFNEQLTLIAIADVDFDRWNLKYSIVFN